MVATWNEVAGSRSGNSERITRKFYGQFCTDETDVANYAATLPSIIADLPVADYDYQEVEEVNDGGLHDYELTVNWGLPKNNTGQKHQTIEYKFNFQAPGGHIRQSLSTISSYSDDTYFPFSYPNFGGAINVTEDKSGVQKVEGQSVQPPAEVFTLSYKCDDSQISDSYQLLVESLCGMVNSSSFRGRPAGSVMLVRATGGRDTSGSWHIEFGFGYIANATGIPVGNMTVAKDGFDLLWAYYGLSKDDVAKVAATKPTAAFVERVYYRADLNQLNLPA